MPAETAAGRLAVRAVANGSLQDALVRVTRVDTGETGARGRTYASPETNPRVIPLAVGTFDIIVTEAVHLLRALAFPERSPVRAPPPPIAG